MQHCFILKRISVVLFAASLTCMAACENNAVEEAIEKEGVQTVPALAQEDAAADSTVLIALYLPGQEKADGALLDMAASLSEGTGGELYALNDLQPASDSVADGDIAQYDIIFLGYPVQDNTVPAAVMDFLTEQDLTGKTILPFCIHSGEGAGSSFADIASAAQGADVVQAGFEMQPGIYSADNLRAYISAWVEGLYTLGYNT